VTKRQPKKQGLPMPQYDITLTPERTEQLCEIARDRGISIDQVVSEFVQSHMVNLNKITRFVAKKGPRKAVKNDSANYGV
jgi:hypothetical protein